MADGPEGAAARPDVMLETRGLTRRYPGGARPAVADVSLAVGRGEIVGLVGASGAGKSTLLRLVAGLEAPDAGTVRVAGRTVSGPGAWTPPEARPLGMLFQEGALFPHLDVAGNVEFGLRGHGRKERRRRRAEVLELVGLSGYGDRRPHQLSGGERRRVALARALAPGPELLLLDEPFTGLDASLTGRLRSEVGRILRETGTTALIVLHDTGEVLPLADRIAVLGRGRLAQAGPPEEVYARPRTEYVARLFGPVNVLPARRRGAQVESALGIAPPTEAASGAGELRLCYRPEDLEVGPPGAYACEATVVETGFRGDRQEVRVRLSAGGAAGAVLRAHRDPAEGGDATFEAGAAVSVRARPGRGHVLRRAEGEESPDGVG